MNGIHSEKQKHFQVIKKIANAIVISLWLILVALCLYYKDQITVDRIVNASPKNMVVAALLMLLLFALKSVTVVIYGGILYAVSGILFSLPVAILINTLGSIIMASVPFGIGRKAGSKVLESLIAKNHKLEILHSITGKNDFWVSFFTRIVGMLPSDLVGVYLGANKLNYIQYIAGTIAGLMPAILLFSIMGMSINDMTSPEFVISACFEVCLTAFSIVMYLLWRRRKRAER